MRYVNKFGKENILKKITWFNFSFRLKASLCKEVSHATFDLKKKFPFNFFYWTLPPELD